MWQQRLSTGERRPEAVDPASSPLPRRPPPCELDVEHDAAVETGTLRSILDAAATGARRACRADVAVAALSLTQAGGPMLLIQGDPADGLPVGTVRAAAARLAGGTAILTADLAHERRGGLRAAASRGIRSLAGVRIQLGPQTGCLLAGAGRGGRFSMTDLVALRAVARRAAVDHLRAVSRSGQRQVGRALHDSFGQTLTSIVFALHDLEGVLETDAQRVLARQVRAHASAALDQLRRVIDVATAGGRVPRERGLDLVELARRFAGPAVAVHVVNRLGSEPIPRQIVRCLRQVAREALLNVRRHTDARTVRMAARRRRRSVVLAISDDGQGLRPGRRRTWGGSGLAIIRQRVGELDGVFSFQSVRGKGTRLSVSLPCPR